MNDRERFIKCMQFEEVDRVPVWEWGFRRDTTERWHREGLPLNVPDEVGWTELLKLDRGGGYAGGSMAERLDVSTFLVPDFEQGPIEEDERTAVSINRWGATIRRSKVGESIPQYLRFGVETRADFERYKSRWNPDDPARYPADWEARKNRWKDRTFPVSMFTYGWYGVLRELMGVEGLSVALHEDERLIDDICEFWGGMIMRTFARALRETDPDYLLFWEDLAYKTGPLLSPRHFRRFFLPHYKRVIEHFRRHGVKLFMVDSDGNIDDMLPLWIEAGVNILGPFEVSAGMDVRKVAREYGDRLAMVGGIDKMEIAKGHQAIDRELEVRVKPLLSRGGYIPTLDHSPIPEISFQDYLYYRGRLRKLCEGEG